MAVVKGSGTTLKVGGTAVAVTGEATTDVGGTHTVYQITDATRRAIDWNTAVVVKTNGAPDATGTVDYNHGKVTFGSAKGGGDTVTFDYSYLPLLSLLSARKADVSASKTELDSTVYSSAAKARLVGNEDITLQVEQLEPIHTDLDSGAGTRKPGTDYIAGTVLFVEHDPGAVGTRLRGPMLITDVGVSSSPDALVPYSLTLKSAPQSVGSQPTWA